MFWKYKKELGGVVVAESLRDIYKNKKDILEKQSVKKKGFLPFLRRHFWPFDLFKDLSNIANMHLQAQVNKFICHNCFKSVLVEKLDFQCPFCDSKYGELGRNASEEKVDGLLGVVVKGMIISMDYEQKEAALFDKCKQCDRKIQFVECYHCHKPINLFAPYNKEELEAKAYV